MVLNFIRVGCLELLFFRSEVKMAAPDVEFMTKECRAVMKFLFLNGKSAKDIYDDMSVTLGKKSPSYSTVKNWVAQFKTGLSALKMKTIQEGHLWSLCLKM